MLPNAYFLAKFCFDTAEKEPAKHLQNFAKKIANFAKLYADEVRCIASENVAVTSAPAGAVPSGKATSQLWHLGDLQ